ARGASRPRRRCERVVPRDADARRPGRRTPDVQPFLAAARPDPRHDRVRFRRLTLVAQVRRLFTRPLPPVGRRVGISPSRGLTVDPAPTPASPARISTHQDGRHMISTRTKRVSLAAVAAAGLIALAGCSGTSADEGSANSDWPETLTFAQIPSESATSIAEANAPIIDALEQELGIEVELQEATSYAAVVEALRAGQVDIGSMGPFSYVVAADSDAGVIPVGALADSPDEAASYRSYGIVPAGSDITSLEDFAGKKVCYVDQTSTSGFLFPSAGLLEA